MPLDQENLLQNPNSTELKALLQAETMQLHPILQCLKGEFYICFGPLLQAYELQQYQWPHWWFYKPLLTGQDQEYSHRFILGEYTDLSFLSESIDHFVCAHILDFYAQKRYVLKELWRCLVPDGKVVITGFNRYYLFGLPPSIPRDNLISAAYLRRLLRSQGFEIETYKTFYFRPRPFYGQDALIGRLIDVFGQMFWPKLGSIYMFVIKKPVLGMTPLFESQQKTTVTIKGLVEPAPNR